MKKALILSIVLSFMVTGCSLTGDKPVVIGVEEAKAKVDTFINETLMQPGSATIGEVVEEDGLYKVAVNLKTGEEIISYLSLDGKNFFPQSMVIEDVEIEVAGNKEGGAEAPAPVDVPKTEKPSVEIYVMSHCPYGTQIEKGILPVLDTLGDAIDFELKFCTYAMHGKKELDEQMTQHCIQKEEGLDKLKKYLMCFLADESKSTACMKEVGIGTWKIGECVKATDKEFAITEGFNDKSTWMNDRFPVYGVNKADNEKYGVAGSPGLVVNGVKVNSGRSPQALLTTICAGFENAPAGCEETLSSENPSAGFGFGAPAGGSGGGCGE